MNSSIPIPDMKEIRKEYHISKIGLFGSYARNEQKQNSDIDLIFEFNENANHLFATKETVRELISKQFGTNVDL